MAKLAICDVCQEMNETTRATWTVREVTGKIQGGRPKHGIMAEVCVLHISNAVSDIVETEGDLAARNQPSDLRYIEIKMIEAER